jgi:hypothetical protein
MVQPQVLQQQTMQQVVVVKPARPYPAFLENKALMVFILIGVIFLMLGSIMVNVSPEITNKDYSGYSNPTNAQNSDLRLKTTVRVLNGAIIFTEPNAP